MLLLTQSDRLLTSEGGHPSLTDIAVGLSRQPRFGGQTREWWSVLDHSLFCDELVKSQESTRELRLAVLLHDAHEALTGDVPTPFKTPDFRAVQDDLDRRICGAFFPGGYDRYAKLGTLVKNVDLRALRAEARQFLNDENGVVPQVFGDPDPGDVTRLGYYRSTYRRESYRPLEKFGRDTPLVDEYLERLLYLL